MDLPVFLIVLAAALFHATWNAFIEADGDRVAFMAVMVAWSGLGALVATPFLPVPDPQSWPYIALSVLLHQGYVICLLLAYRFGDLSHVYPLARGSAPLVVARVTITLIGEQLTRGALLAIVLIGLGIMSLSFARGAQKLRNPLVVAFALATGLLIAGYTVTDGMGARAAGNAHSYSAWMLGLEWIPVTAYVLFTRRKAALTQTRRTWTRAAVMGFMSLAAYWSVIWAMTVAPIALVAALRETSIVFAVLFGVVFVKERLDVARVAATFATLLGVVLLKTNRP